MGGRDGSRKYLYWSDRQIRAVAADNGVDVEAARPEPSVRRIELAGAPRRMDRDSLALSLELAIGRRAVWDFVSPPPTRFAKGRGTIVLSELAQGLPDPTFGLAFTTTVASNGCRVAICLFGAIANLSEVITDVTPRAKGWSASSARVVSAFVTSRCTVVDAHWGTVPALVAEIVKIAVRQGEEGHQPDLLDRPWTRGFTYGHVGAVGEWFAEVFCDLRTAELPASRRAEIAEITDAFDRIIVGSPLWLRTPSLRALTLYDEIPPAELDLDLGRYE